MICRACGAKNIESAVSLLHPSNYKLRELLSQLHGKFQFEESNLPTVVCESCYKSLSEFSDFTGQSSKAQDVFRRTQEKIKTTEIKPQKQTFLQKWLTIKKEPHDENFSNKIVTNESLLKKHNITNVSVKLEKLRDTLIEKLTNKKSDLDYANDSKVHYQKIKIEHVNLDSFAYQSSSDIQFHPDEISKNSTSSDNDNSGYDSMFHHSIDIKTEDLGTVNSKNRTDTTLASIEICDNSGDNDSFDKSGFDDTRPVQLETVTCKNSTDTSTLVSNDICDDSSDNDSFDNSGLDHSLDDTEPLKMETVACKNSTDTTTLTSNEICNDSSDDDSFDNSGLDHSLDNTEPVQLETVTIKNSSDTTTLVSNEICDSSNDDDSFDRSGLDDTEPVQLETVIIKNSTDEKMRDKSNNDIIETSESCTEPLMQSHDETKQNTDVDDAKMVASDKKGQVFQCSKCKFKTFSSYDLKNHSRQHTPAHTFKCDKCYSIFISELHLNEHKIKYHSSDRKLRCNICLKSYRIKKILNLHKKFHYPKKFCCNTCNKLFYTLRDLTQHILRFHLNKIYKCNECSSTFKNKSSLRLHIVKVHLKLCNDNNDKKRNIKCPKCNKSFKLRSYMLRHYTIHTELRLFKCNKCDKSFKSPREVTQHETTVHAVTFAYTCKQCGSKFRAKSRLNAHINSMHNKKSDIKKFSCKICGKKFVKSGFLKTHTLFVHDATYKYPCTKCSSKFKTNSHLQRHIQSMHDDSKLFKCQVCNKSFKSAYNLKLHGKVHSDVRPFPCNQCTSAFKSKQELKGHFLRMHTDERAFKCNYCSKSFVVAGDLKVHMNALHTKFKKYPCDECFEVFNCASNLRSHKVRWHKVEKFAKKLVIPKTQKIFTCSKCKYTSNFKNNLVRHITRHCLHTVHHKKSQK